MRLIMHLTALILLVSCSRQLKGNIKQDDAESPSTGSRAVISLAYPASLPAAYKSSDFNVNVSGTSVAVYNAGDNSWGNRVSYGTFEMSAPVSLTVTPAFSFSSFKILPQSAGITGVKSGNTLTIPLSASGNISIVFDNNYQGKVLHLFAQTIDTNVPSGGSSTIIYYGAGYHDLSTAGPIQLNSNQTLYLAAGAVVRGSIKANGVNNVTVRGRGILINDYNSATDNIALSMGAVTNSTIRDIIVNRNVGSWTASMHGCSFIDVINYRAVSPKFASTDGFNINSSHDITFDSAFIRSADDAIAIKGMSDQVPASSPPVYNIVYKNAQLWADANNTIGIGAETKASGFYNITFKNIDVLYNFDDRNHPDVLPDRSAINIFALQSTYIHDIKFEDIRVEKAKRLINIHMDETFYFGALTGNWTSYPGSIYNISYKNITSSSDGSNQIKLQGWNDTHRIDGVSFENIVINGNTLTSFSDNHFNVNRFANNLQLTGAGNVKFWDTYKAEADFSTQQGKRHWNYRGWKAGVGTYLMNWNTDGSNHWRGPNDYDAIWLDNAKVYLHPDNGAQSMLEWTAPKTGTVRIRGTVKKGNLSGGDGVNASIWKNGSMIWPVNGSWYTLAYNDVTGVSQDLTITVNFGDVLSFRVDQRSNSGWDTTEWTPEIVYQ